MADINGPEVLLGAVLALAATELTDWLPRISAGLIRRAARALPNRAEVREQEWLANLEHLPGKWSGLFYALSCVLLARAAVAEAIARRVQQVLVWAARVMLLGLVGAVVQRAPQLLTDAGLWLACGVGLALLVPALGRREFDPFWYPPFVVPRWVWWILCALIVLTVLNGLWFGDVQFAGGVALLVAAAYGRDMRGALAQLAPRPAE